MVDGTCQDHVVGQVEGRLVTMEDHILKLTEEISDDTYAMKIPSERTWSTFFTGPTAVDMLSAPESYSYLETFSVSD